MGYKVGDEVIGYKVGDEVMVKARIIEDCIGICGLKTQEGIVFNAKKENLLPIPDMTAEEAWDIARKIVLLEDEGGIPSKDMVRMFGVKFPRDIVREYSEHEVKARIEAWEAEKEIKVGDEVEFDDTANDIHRSMYVTSKYNDTDYCGICRNGDTYCVHKSSLKKTGRHINIEGFLNKIGGDE